MVEVVPDWGILTPPDENLRKRATLPVWTAGAEVAEILISLSSVHHTTPHFFAFWFYPIRIHGTYESITFYKSQKVGNLYRFDSWLIKPDVPVHAALQEHSLPLASEAKQLQFQLNQGPRFEVNFACFLVLFVSWFVSTGFGYL